MLGETAEPRQPFQEAVAISRGGNTGMQCSRGGGQRGVLGLWAHSAQLLGFDSTVEQPWGPRHVRTTRKVSRRQSLHSMVVCVVSLVLPAAGCVTADRLLSLSWYPFSCPLMGEIITTR